MAERPMRYRLSELTFDCDRALPELQALGGADAAPAETRVIWSDARIAPIPSTPFSSWLTADGRDWLTFADHDGGFLLTFPEHGQFEMTRDASVVTVHPFAPTPSETMRHLLLNQILPLVLSRRGRFVLHASAVSFRDRVVAFIGRSGGGKSTLAVACALAGAAIVSDDCLVLNRREGAWSAVPCHTGVRLWPGSLDLFGWPTGAGEAAAPYSEKLRFDERHHGLMFEARELPIAAILYLPPVSASEAPSPALGPGAASGALRGSDAVMALTSEVFRVDSRDPIESRRQFTAVGELAVEVPVELMTRAAPEKAAQALLCRMADSWRRSGD